jgi:MFS family permease
LLRTRGVRPLLAAQFFSALADHALLILAIDTVQAQGDAAAWAPALKVALVAAYVLLAPWIGPLADVGSKPRLMLATNALKALAVLALLAGLLGPLAAMLLVGIGAAVYAPAKYGLLTELVPAHRLVAANGWLEGLTVAAALGGTAIGALLLAPELTVRLRAWGLAADVAPLLVLLLLYALAAVLNLWIPDSGLRHRLAGASGLWRTAWLCMRDHAAAQRALWRDREAALSMAVTTLLWGVAGVLQFVVLRWGQEVLGLSLDRAALLQAAVALGVVAGAAAAGRWVPLAQAPRALPLALLLGAVLPGVALLREGVSGTLVLAVCGALAGWLVVPMNALLQHRGLQLLSAGRSVAVQNFNENASVLLTLLAYAAAASAGLDLAQTLAALGAWVTLSVAAVAWWHWPHWRRAGRSPAGARPADRAMPPAPL